jgi:hypothetical protein
MGYSVEYHEARDESGNAEWSYRILRDGIVFALSPRSSPYPTKLDAEMMAEEIIMRLEEADSEADIG